MQKDPCQTLTMVANDIRQRYAEEIRTNSNLASPALLKAFAGVPREEFVGSGPWKVLSRVPGQMQAQVADVTDPAELYRDVAIMLDPSRSLTNGNPGTLAPWLDALNLSVGKSVFHLGCGTGYYTAIMAEMVGPKGRITAVEIDPALAAQARANLSRYSNVEVVQGDGGTVDTGIADAILINAGVTHPRESWLDNLQPAGTLVLPLTVEFGMPHVGKGMVLRVSRLRSGYAAQFLPIPVMIYSCSSVRDSEFGSLLSKPFMSGTCSSVKSLRRDPHSSEPDCWLHTSTFCLSTRPLI
ncbi:MAG: methyltransferase domain-containing protein [Candidatus Acidiferrales bacterium]